MSERTEKFQAEIDREYQKAARAQARATAGPMGLVSAHPIIFVLGIVIGVVLLIVIAPPPDGPEKRAAYDKAKLECRISGGTYEYFGTQGYVCIPSRNQDGGSVR